MITYTSNFMYKGNTFVKLLEFLNIDTVEDLTVLYHSNKRILLMNSSEYIAFKHEVERCFKALTTIKTLPKALILDTKNNAISVYF